MKKITAIIVLALIASYTLSAATKILPLPGVNKPEQLVTIDKERMYVIEGSSIFIYSLKDFKLIKKFGKRGEGPREFMTNHFMGPMGALWIDVQQDNILIKSVGKLSWYTKQGTFIKEKKSPVPLMWMVFPFGKHTVMLKYDMGNVRYRVLTAFNEKLEEVKQLEKREDDFQLGKGMTVLKSNPIQAIYKNRLYTAWSTNFQVKVYDADYKLLYTIKHPVERLKVTDDLKKKVIQFFKTSPMTKDYFEMMKPIRFPEYFPAVAAMFISGDKIYVVTFNSTSPDEFTDDTDVLIFDLKGKFLKKAILPIKRMDPIMPFPYTIHEGKMYQMVENEDKEEYEVYITDIK